MRNLIEIKNKLFLGGLSGLKGCLVIFRSLNVLLLFFSPVAVFSSFSNPVAKELQC